MTTSTFWNDQDKAKQIIQEVKALNSVLKPFEALVRQADNLEASIELAEEAGTDEFDDEVQSACKRAESDFSAFEFRSMLGGPNDHCNAFVTIHAGAGGTEACDWAEMLLRMYLMWAESKGFKAEITDREDGGAAGVQEASVHIKGEYAYGYLRGESGVHRLVRISPFDSASRRHTSFASVDVLPEVDDTIDIVLKMMTSSATSFDPVVLAASIRTRPSRGSAIRTSRPALPPNPGANAPSTRTTPTPSHSSRPSSFAWRKRSARPNSPRSTTRRGMSASATRSARTCSSRIRS